MAQQSAPGLDPSLASMAQDAFGIGTAQQQQSNAAMSHTAAQAASQAGKPYFLNNPTADMGPGSLLLAGTGRGMMDLVRHAGNLVGLQSDQDLQNAKQLDAPLLNTRPGELGSMLGQTAATAPVAMGAGAGMGAMGNVGARLAANPISMGALQGALQGGVVADPGQRLQGAGMGAVAGAALPTLGAVGSKMVNGLSRTPAAQTLLNAGVSLTPGQMNPTGVTNRMEQALEGVAGVGDLVQNARTNSMQQYSRAMVERSMAPGATLPKSVTNFNDMIDAAGKSFDTAYDVGKGFPVGAKIMNQTGPDVPLTQALKNVTTRAQPGMTSQDQAAVGSNLQDLLQQQINDARQSGKGLQSDDLLDFRSQIRDMIRGEDGLTNASRARKQLYSKAADQVTAALNSQIPKDAAQAIQATDAQYGKFKIIQDAAAVAKDKDVTPYQISSAIAKATPKSVYAAGGGANRDLSQAATETFQNNVPRTGLAGMGRLALPLAAAGGIAKVGGVGALHPALTAPALAGYAGLTLTPWGRSAAAGQTALQRAMQGGLMQLQGAVPQTAQNLAGLYGRGGLVSLMDPRVQQMPSGQ